MTSSSIEHYDVAILTESRYLNNPTETLGERNVLQEDTLICQALERKGLRVIRVDWADKTIDWKLVRYALFRSTWDYMLRFKEFKAWFDRTKKVTQFINDADIIEWNLDKHYLQDMALKGINIPQTIFIPRLDKRTLQELLAANDWEEAVVKPTVSNSSNHTYRISKENVEEHEEIYQKVIQQEDMMIQPFLKNIMERGEVSLVVIGGKYSHSVLKVAKPGDFRVQDDFGGTVHPYKPTMAEMKFEEEAVVVCPSPPLYARIDIALDNVGEITLIELELIEPELWFRQRPEAADKLAEGIMMMKMHNDGKQ